MTYTELQIAPSPRKLLASLKQSATSSRQPVFAAFFGDNIQLDDRTYGSWCSDTRKAEPLLKMTFSGTADEEKSLQVVFVGDKATWKDPSNVWRGEPFELTAVPTLVKSGVDGTMTSLVEADVYDQDKLYAFVNSN